MRHFVGRANEQRAQFVWGTQSGSGEVIAGQSSPVAFVGAVLWGIGFLLWPPIAGLSESDARLHPLQTWQNSILDLHQTTNSHWTPAPTMETQQPTEATTFPIHALLPWSRAGSQGSEGTARISRT